MTKYSNLPNNRAGWNKRAGWTFFKVYCTFIRQAIVKTGKKGPNKDVQDGFFPKKNKVCCTIIWQVKVHISNTISTKRLSVLPFVRACVSGRLCNHKRLLIKVVTYVLGLTKCTWGMLQ